MGNNYSPSRVHFHSSPRMASAFEKGLAANAHRWWLFDFAPRGGNPSSTVSTPMPVVAVARSSSLPLSLTNTQMCFSNDRESIN